MARFAPRLDALPDAQRRLWPSLRPLARLGFVLYGGTAISLRLGHRQSVDFDFFTSRPLDRQTLDKRLPWLTNSVALQATADTLTVLTQAETAKEASEEDIKVSLFGALSFGRLADPDVTADGVAQVASMEDLLATKLKTLLQRVEAKDYQDIAALLGAGADLGHGLAGARALYGPAFQPAECLKALVYFEGGDLETLPTEIREALIQAAAKVAALPEVVVRSHALAPSRPTSSA